MPPAARSVQRTYLTLTLLSTLAASFIWGINTLFLLDAGLSTTQAFAANACFALGMVLFEIPTGIVADTLGRRTSFLLGTITLLAATLVYLAMWEYHAPFWGWAAASTFIGLGFTFFSGAVEAWLVDALDAAGFSGDLATVFGKGQAAAGIAMLAGSVAGGFVAQATNLGVPYLIRSGVLVITLVVAFIGMHDHGFTPRRGGGVATEARALLRASVDAGWRNPPVRWIMAAGACSTGVGLYVFYAMQPHLLDLYGDQSAFGIAGIAAAVLAAAQIAGGLSVQRVGRVFRRRTDALLAATLVGAGALAIIGLTTSFAVAIGFLAVWSMAFSAARPVRQAYLNAMIASEQRATVLSFDALTGSGGGVVAQPLLGRSADAWGYGTSFAISAGVQTLAIPFLVAARRRRAPGEHSG